MADGTDVATVLNEFFAYAFIEKNRFSAALCSCKRGQRGTAWSCDGSGKWSKSRRPLGEDWLRVGAIIAEFNISGYGVAR